MPSFESGSHPVNFEGTQEQRKLDNMFLQPEVGRSNHKSGNVLESMNRSMQYSDHNDSVNIHNTSLGNLSNQRIDTDNHRPRTGIVARNDLNDSSQNSQDISMLSANKNNSGDKNLRKQRAVRAEDLDQKLLSLNDIMMQASQNKIDAD